jgi:Cytochrome C and Quinol oxidase polypeptide I
VKLTRDRLSINGSSRCCLQKFFAALAVLQLGFALLAARAANQSLDVYFHATYFVIAPIHLQILLAISSACFALIYFAAFRWLPHPLSNSLGLTHIVLATIAFVLLSGVSVRARLDSRWLTTGPTIKSVADSRGCARSAEFPFGLRHTRRESYMDRH